MLELAVIVAVILATGIAFWRARHRRRSYDDPTLASHAHAEAERKKYDWYGG